MAAAVISIGVGATNYHPKSVMVVKQPFLFVIRDHQTDGIIFIGRIADPEWKN